VLEVLLGRFEGLADLDDAALPPIDRSLVADARELISEFRGLLFESRIETVRSVAVAVYLVG
jgi:hypothetical protein